MGIATTIGKVSLRVLLAERDPVVRERFRALGEEAGWVCESVPEASDVLQALASSEYDILITDLVIPNMSPEDLLKNLRGEDSAHGGRRVIVLAARELMGSADQWIRGGAADVVMAPARAEVVKAAVERVYAVCGDGVVGEADLADRSVSSERGVWELTSRELAVQKFPLHIVDRLYRAGRIDKTDKLRLELAFQEALLNSLEHGNLELDSVWREEFDDAGVDRYGLERRRRLSDDGYGLRKVFIETVLEGACLTIRIRDEGPGFVPPPAVTPPTQHLCSGRGLAIIKGSVDEVHFAHDGTEITLTKILPS